MGDLEKISSYLDYIKKQEPYYKDILLTENSISCLNKNIHSISIPEDISTIEYKGFSDCTNLKSISIPENVNLIKKNGFSNCSKLENINIPYKVTNLEENTFSNCVNLKDVNFNSNLNTIGEKCFENCKSLKNIDLPKNLKTIGAYSFYNCSSLSSLVLPDSIKTIEEGAFLKCTNLSNVRLSENIDKLNIYSFGFCSNLTSIKIPDKVKQIKSLAFYNCSNLSQIQFSKNLEFIGFDAFNNCTSLNMLKLPDSILNISPGAFSYCLNLSSINLPNKLSFLSSRIFSNCKKLHSIDIPNSVKKIDGYAFFNCIELQNLKLSKNLSMIGTEAFRNCTKLKEIKLPNSLKSIGSSAFDSCVSLRKINLPNSIISLQTMTFYNCSLLKEVTLPQSLQIIGERCFSNCMSLKKVVFSEGVYSINTEAFKNCASLTSLSFPNSLRIIGKNAFENCKNLTDVYFHKRIKFIGEDAFKDCKDIVLHGEKKSYVHQYAVENNLQFKEYKYIPVRKILFKDNFLNLNQHKSQKLDLIFVPENTTDKNNVLWESSNEEVASVNDGIITTHDVGNTIITATVGNKSAKCIVSLEVPLEKISLDKTSLVLNKNKTKSLHIEYFPKNHTCLSEPIWSSSNKDIAVVDRFGNINAINKGNCEIICKLEDKIAVCNLKVTIPLEEIVFDESSINLQVDQTYKINVSFLPKDTTDHIDLVFSSTDESIISVDSNGNIKALKDGTAIVMASTNDKIATCIVNVRSSITHIKFLQNKFILSTHDSQKLKILDNNNNIVPYKDIVWSVSDSNIAYIKDNTVFAKSKGLTVLIAQVDNLVATCILTVNLNKIRLFSINYIKENATTITGKGIEGATVRAYKHNKPISNDFIIGRDKTFVLDVDKQEAGSKILVEISRDGYEKRQESVTVLHEFKEFTVDSIDVINENSISIVGKGLKESYIRAYIKNTQIGKTTVVSSNGMFNLILPKLKSNTTIILKMRKSLYVTATKNILISDE